MSHQSTHVAYLRLPASIDKPAVTALKQSSQRRKQKKTNTSVYLGTFLVNAGFIASVITVVLKVLAISSVAGMTASVSPAIVAGTGLITALIALTATIRTINTIFTAVQEVEVLKIKMTALEASQQINIAIFNLIYISMLLLSYKDRILTAIQNMKEDEFSNFKTDFETEFQTIFEKIETHQPMQEETCKDVSDNLIINYILNHRTHQDEIIPASQNPASFLETIIKPSKPEKLKEDEDEQYADNLTATVKQQHKDEFSKFFDLFIDTFISEISNLMSKFQQISNERETEIFKTIQAKLNSQNWVQRIPYKTMCATQKISVYMRSFLDALKQTTHTHKLTPIANEIQSITQQMQNIINRYKKQSSTALSDTQIISNILNDADPENTIAGEFKKLFLRMNTILTTQQHATVLSDETIAKMSTEPHVTHKQEDISVKQQSQTLLSSVRSRLSRPHTAHAAVGRDGGGKKPKTPKEAAHKQYVTLPDSTRKYRVHVDEESKKKFINKSKHKVFLSTIKGKYKYAKE